MKSKAISEFKDDCLALIEEVQKSGEPLLLTRNGVPVAQVVLPPIPSPKPQSAFGCMKGTARVLGNIVEPLPPEDWEALQ